MIIEEKCRICGKRLWVANETPRFGLTHRTCRTGDNVPATNGMREMRGSMADGAGRDVPRPLSV